VKAEAVEQALADGARSCHTAVGPVDLRSGAVGDGIQLLPVGVQVTLRIVPGADQQRGLVEREVISPDDLGEPGQPRASVHMRSVASRTPDRPIYRVFVR